MSRKKPTALGMKIAGVLMHDTVSKPVKKTTGAKAAVSEPSEYRPTLTLHHARIPELKNRKLGETVRLIAQGIITSMDMNTYGGKGQGSSTVQLDKVGVDRRRRVNKTNPSRSG